MEHLAETMELLLLIAIGFVYKLSLTDDATSNALKGLIIKLFLPILIFTAFSSLDTHMHFTIYPVFAIVYSFFLFVFFRLLLKNTTSGNDYFTEILMLSTFAPGLSVYPFILTFMGRADLAEAALLDFGEKLFIFIFIYFSSYFILGRNANFPINQEEKQSQRILTVLKNVIIEPVNIAIFLGALLVILDVQIVNIAPGLAKILVDIGDTTVILVMLFIGLSLKKFDLIEGTQSFVLLLMRVGLGFMFTALFCYSFGIYDRNVIVLLAAYTLGSISFWPYINMLYLNKLYQTDFYNDVLALQILAFSFPLTIALMLALFNFRSSMSQRPILLMVGVVITIISLIAYFFVRYIHQKQ